MHITMTTEPFAMPSPPDVLNQGSLRAVIFDYGGVLTYVPTQDDWERMAFIVRTPLPKMLDAYWLHRYPYEIGRYDSEKYWGLVGRDCGVQLSGEAFRKLVEQDNQQW